MMKSWITPLLLLTLSVALPLIASAENSTRKDGFIVHHNAIPSAMLTPEIANRYGLVRSKYRGFLNVSVIQEVPGTVGRAVSARVKARAINLAGKAIDIPMRETRDGAAIYYLGEFPIIDREQLRFSLEVQPEGLGKPIKAELQQQFFID